MDVYEAAPISSSFLSVFLTGDAGEEVELAFAEVTIQDLTAKLLSVKCTLSAAGRATATVYLRSGSVPECR